MPNYEGNISPEEISSVVSQSNVQLQNVSRSLDQMNNRLDRMTDLFDKVRDYTQDEVKELNNYKKEISDVASAYRKLHGEKLKGMSDYSVALKAAEDRLEALSAAEKKAIEENKALRERTSRLQEATEGRMNKTKKKVIEEELNVRGKSAKELRKAAEEELKLTDKKFIQNRDIIRQSQREQEIQKKNLESAEKLKKIGDQRVNRRRGRGDLLEMASDLNLPGVSAAATIAKYGRRGAEEAGGGEGPGGLGGLLGGGMGLLRGGAIVAGGYTALQGYRAYRTAEQMAPVARTLAGQMGRGSVAARQQGVEAYGGYGGLENLQVMTQLNRALGGQAGAKQLHGVTDIANRFGLQREEVVGQAGAGFQAGMSPATAARDMQRIMMEAVKGGMDRSRVTQFTQEALSVQQDIFKATGENNAQAIAEAMSQLMKASGQGEQFLRGPAMQAFRGIDAAIKAAGRGQMQGPGAGTLFRAFGFGAGSQGGGAGTTEEYYNARRKMEGGLFGEKGASGKDILGRLNAVFNQYLKESGGNKKISNLRMADEMGLGIRQVEQLGGIRERAAKGQISKEDIKKLQELQEEAKDPMMRILDIQAKMDSNLAKLAGSDQGVAAVVSINTKILAAQESSLSALDTIARALTGQGTENRMGDILKVGAGAVGAGALFAPGKTAKAAGYLGKGIGALGSGAAALGGGGAAGLATTLGGVGIAGAAGYAAGTGINYLADKFTGQENQFGEKSNIFERGIGKAMTYLPEWAGGISDKKYQQMYGAAPRGAAGGGEGQQQMGPKLQVSDDKNTEATSANTAAIRQLTQMMGGQKGVPASHGPSPHKAVRGNIR